jgi:F0F1-type ATP synthase delta subunit
MISKKKITKIARIMYKNSFTGEYLDESKISQILDRLSKYKMQGFIKILKFYKRLVEIQIAREQVIIETPFKLDKRTEDVIIAKTSAKKINYQINPNLVFGAKIKHGDWVYDNTLDSKLDLIVQDNNLTRFASEARRAM